MELAHKNIIDLLKIFKTNRTSAVFLYEISHEEKESSMSKKVGLFIANLISYNKK